MLRVPTFMAAESSDATSEIPSFEAMAGRSNSAGVNWLAAMSETIKDEEATVSRGRDESIPPAQRPSSGAAPTSPDYPSGGPIQTRGGIKKNLRLKAWL